jgi:hypothetical protein
VGAVDRACDRRRGAARRARAVGERSSFGGGRGLTLLIREGPATELTIATRILVHYGLLAEDGRVALLVGSEVVYLAGRGARAATMTPYDVCALRLGDGSELSGDPPADAARYVDALRGDRRHRAVALTRGGLTVAPGVLELVERLSGSSWDQAESAARGAGALVGVYPSDG